MKRCKINRSCILRLFLALNSNSILNSTLISVVNVFAIGEVQQALCNPTGSKVKINESINLDRYLGIPQSDAENRY